MSDALLYEATTPEKLKKLFTEKNLYSLTSVNAAHDYVKVLEMIQSENNDPSIEYYLLGISYGTHVAQMASKLAIQKKANFT